MRLDDLRLSPNCALLYHHNLRGSWHSLVENFMCTKQTGKELCLHANMFGPFVVT